MVIAATLLLRRASIGLGWLPLVALLRAAVQLGSVALLLGGVITAPWTAVLFVVLMFSTASLTTARRARELPRGRLATVTGTIVGAGTAIGVILATGQVGLSPVAVIAVAGIVVGGCMSVATLSSRHYLSGVRARRDEVEAWLSLGARPWEAVDLPRREAVREALIPNLDQTKSTGLVTLPGAFVGALFGGATALEAAQFQLIVLAGLAFGGTITALLTTRIASRSSVLPADPA